MPELTDVDVQLNERDLDWTYTKGSGSGGQKRNKTSSAVQLTHIPSGFQIRCEAGRSQLQNRETALVNLRMQLWTVKRDRLEQEHASARKHQVGAGQRGDKRRTIRTQDDHVVDHITGKSWSWDRYRRGIWE
jgi:peptide chain release factor 1